MLRQAGKSINSYVVSSQSKALNSYASTESSLYPSTSSSEICVVWPCSILPMRDEVLNWVVAVESTRVRRASFDWIDWLPWEVYFMSRFRRFFFLGRSCDPYAVGVMTSVWFEVAVLLRAVVWLVKGSTSMRPPIPLVVSVVW